MGPAEALARHLRGWARAIGRLASRIGTRLLLVNFVVALVPVAGVEFARLYEQRLLEALQRDMVDQAALVVAFLGLEMERGIPLGDPRHTAALERAARTTRTRVRVVAADGSVVLDSHANGPPEGPERTTPSLLDGTTRARSSGPRWPELPRRPEVLAALRGERHAAATRYRARDPGVLLFVAEPIPTSTGVAGAVYVVRSTQPVLADLHRIREGLTRVLAVALGATLALTLLFAWSISRPLSKLASAARRIAAGERSVHPEVEGLGEIRELGEAVATMTRQLEQRVTYARDLAADVAHEFKSPLTSIRGAAELLADGAVDDPEARARFLSNIALDVDRLDRLVSQLLSLGRIEASERAPSPTCLASLARRVAKRSESPDVRVEVVAAGDETTVLARESDVEMAVSNLIDNAVRYSPPGSAVTVRVETGPTSVRIDVRDRGPGIPEANRSRVFDRFFTTEDQRQGTGLGLSIVRAVAESHGGRAEIVDTGAEGTTFRLTLPRRA